MAPLPQHPACLLCGSSQTVLRFRDKKRPYFLCNTCHLLFVPPEWHPTRQAEKAEYDLHENASDDPAYRGFLKQLFEPMVLMIPAGSKGLDFGCGPEPTLSLMFKEAGHHMAVYDSFYAAENKAFNVQYDFITASEVVEHLHHPLEEMQRLWQCLKTGGHLGIMTQLWCQQSSLQKWRYKDHDSHVIYFSRRTFTWLARRLHATEHIINRNVTILQKTS